MTDFIGNWDSGQPGADWDSGLQWDFTSGPNLGDVGPYLALITSEHNQQPKFMRMLANMFSPFADNMAVVRNFILDFDLDAAVGVQLDIVGQWVGASRNVSVALTDVYFTLNSASLGFDSGTWYNLFNPLTGLVILDDPTYRTLIRARTANNQWDGTIPGAYDIWDTLFFGTGVGILIQDFQNMHMLFALTGPVPDAVTLALFRGGYLNLKPAGVMIDAYITPTVGGAPYFGFDSENQSIAGFDVGAFGAIST